MPLSSLAAFESRVCAYKEVPYLDPFSVVLTLSKEREEGLLFLDSCGGNGINESCLALERYSFIGFDPRSVIITSKGVTTIDGVPQTDKPFDVLQQLWRAMKRPQNSELAHLPPWRGGLGGYFGYELLHFLEDVPYPACDVHEVPDMYIGVYDIVYAFDHALGKAWVITQGDMSEARLSYALSLYQETSLPDAPIEAPLDGLNCDFTSESFQGAIQSAIDYIYAGDIFQANITRRLYGTLSEAMRPLALYHRLRSINPAPFSGYMRMNGQGLLSSSPERFLTMKDGHIEARPIKGTRRRSAEPQQDALMGEELRNSVKDRAENIMIVDLMRNDLSRVAKPFSVQTPEICALESYKTVHHLVSVVRADLREGLDAFDVLKATFPGGSITGAPKIRAMEIISELEPVTRGPYCGSMGYIGFDGTMDLNILIRTIVMTGDLPGDTVWFNVGGGIVADSDPLDEYEETITKGAALVRVLVGDC